MSSGNGRTIRVAMIGAGRITDLHYPAYVNFPDAELVTVCDADETVARRRHQEWGTKRWETDYKAVLADPDIDMVEINTPHHLHHPMVLEACKARKHIQLQKPMAHTIQECNEMVAAAKDAGVRLKVIENFIFYPPYRKAKRLLEEGAIGTLLSMRIRLGCAGLGGWWVPLTTWLWRLAETETGGGPVVFDDGYHKFSSAIFFGGAVDRVHAWIDRSLTAIDAPAVISWKHQSGVLGTLDATLQPNLQCTSNYYSSDERIELTGTKGVIWLNRCTGKLLDEPALELFSDGVKTSYEAIETDWEASFRDSTRDFIRSLIENRPASLTGEEASEVQRFCLGALESARRGQPVDLRGEG